MSLSTQPVNTSITHTRALIFKLFSLFLMVNTSLKVLKLIFFGLFCLFQQSGQTNLILQGNATNKSKKGELKAMLAKVAPNKNDITWYNQVINFSEEKTSYPVDTTLKYFMYHRLLGNSPKKMINNPDELGVERKKSNIALAAMMACSPFTAGNLAKASSESSLAYLKEGENQELNPTDKTESWAESTSLFIFDREKRKVQIGFPMHFMFRLSYDQKNHLGLLIQLGAQFTFEWKLHVMSLIMMVASIAIAYSLIPFLSSSYLLYVMPALISASITHFSTEKSGLLRLSLGRNMLDGRVPLYTQLPITKSNGEPDETIYYALGVMTLNVLASMLIVYPFVPTIFSLIGIRASVGILLVTLTDRLLFITKYLGIKEGLKGGIANVLVTLGNYLSFLQPYANKKLEISMNERNNQYKSNPTAFYYGRDKKDQSRLIEPLYGITVPRIPSKIIGLVHRASIRLSCPVPTR